MNTDVAIIGAGPAGIAAAVYALRAGVSVTICERNIYGGQTSIIENIENYPGIKRISGIEFAKSLYDQAKSLGANFVFDEVIDLNISENSKEIILKSSEKLICKSIVISNGLKRRKLGCEGEFEFSGKGVSYCATCDGAFFKGKDVIVVGGGNTAVADALYLSNICNSVTLVVRKDYFRAERFLTEAIKNKNNIKIEFKSRISKIMGDKTVNSVIIKNELSEECEKKIDGVFIAIGYKPDSDIYKNKIDMNESGYFVAGEDCKTNVPGVFVAGDCRTKELRQIATAVSDGAVAGNSSATWCFTH